MNTVTHALAPAIIYSSVELLRKRPLDWKWVLGVALMGSAADVFDPHLELEARFTSWTHNLLGMAAWVVVPFFGALLKQVKWSHCLWLMFAYGLHLFCDAIAGGICLFRPWNEVVVGDYYSMPAQWWYYDGVCLLAMFVIWDLNRKWHGTRLLWWKG